MQVVKGAKQAQQTASAPPSPGDNTLLAVPQASCANE